MKSIRRFSLSKVLLLAIAAMVLQLNPSARPNHHRNIQPGPQGPLGRRRAASGSYTFSLDSQGLPARITVRQVDGPVVAMLLPQSISEDDNVGRPAVCFSIRKVENHWSARCG